MNSPSFGTAFTPPVPRPTGAVALLFSDIEGSTIRWERFGQAMGEALRAHDVLVRREIEDAGGYVFRTLGDAFCAAFATVPDAIAAAVSVQRALAARDWSEVDGLRVRLAIHVGELAEREGDYSGAAIARATRLLAIGHGGQILVSHAAADVVRDTLDPALTLRECGSHRLKDLGAPERVAQITAPGLAPDFPPLRSLDVSPNNLPLCGSAFVGRKAEIAAVKQMLRDARLVTLTGAGGIGKTRTALQVAAEIATDFPDGVWFVELGPLDDGATIATALATLFAVIPRGDDDLVDRVAHALRYKTALVIFDACEHVVAEAAWALEAILRTAPNVRGLATSREALAITGERVFRMPPLDLVPVTGTPPNAELALEHSAVTLFVDRARAVDPLFTLTDENAPAVAAICRRLDGIPFAIELAVPRLRELTPAQLASRLTERLRVLGGGPGERVVPSGHETMRATIAWSYDLLSSDERALFRRLAIFHDGWTLDAATALCCDERLGAWDILELTSALVEKSLVVAAIGSDDKRFAMLEATRAYAREKLVDAAEETDLSRAHAAYYGLAAASIATARMSLSDREWLALATSELENVRAALTWTLVRGNDPPLGTRILFGYLPLWTLALRAEGAMWTRAAEASLDRGAYAFEAAVVLSARATYETEQGDRLAASSAALNAARSVGDADLLRFALTAHGRNLLDSSTFVAGAACLEEALTAHRAAGDRRAGAIVLSYLGDVARWRSRPVRAGERYNEAIALARDARAERAEAIALGSLAELESDEGRLERAAALTTEALELFAAIRDVRNTASSHCNLAGYAIARDAHAEARLHARLALAILRSQEDPFLLTLAVEHLAVVAGLEGDVWRAARLVGFTDAAYARLAFTRELTERRGYERLRARLESSFVATDLDGLLAAGGAFSSDDAVAAALA